MAGPQPNDLKWRKPTEADQIHGEIYWYIQQNGDIGSISWEIVTPKVGAPYGHWVNLQMEVPPGHFTTLLGDPLFICDRWLPDYVEKELG